MRLLRGCLITILVVVVVLVLAIGVLAVTTTPLSAWLYAHNYYFSNLVNALHGRH